MDVHMRARRAGTCKPDLTPRLERQGLAIMNHLLSLLLA